MFKYKSEKIIPTEDFEGKVRTVSPNNVELKQIESKLKRLNKLRTRKHVDVDLTKDSGFNGAVVGQEFDVNVQTAGAVTPMKTASPSNIFQTTATVNGYVADR